MANPEHVKMVQQGAEAIDEWRRKHPGEPLDLTGADLTGANLTRANLFAANLTRADLTGANLTRADLTGADLIGANLMVANLTRADLTGADLTGATLGRTVLGECNLAGCVGLHTVKHIRPSSIGVDTLILSLRGAGNRRTPDLKSFFLGAGVPRELLEALPQILAEVKYGSAFVCHGEPDTAFAERLVKDLKARGVSCWLYALDATPGERTWGEITTKRREAEKMVVLCSAQSLVRDGVLKEIEEQIDEEPDKMVPVSLDNLWNQDSFRTMRTEKFVKIVLYLLDRNYADFGSEATYGVSLEKLSKRLRRTDAANS